MRRRNHIGNVGVMTVGHVCSLPPASQLLGTVPEDVEHALDR